MKSIIYGFQKGKWASPIQVGKGLGKSITATPIKADMFTCPEKQSLIEDPLNADVRDLDVSYALLRMWYYGIEAKGF